MAAHQTFSCATREQLQEKCTSLGIQLPFTDDLTPLSKSVSFGRFTAPNAMVIHPMEGCDARADGSPSDLMLRRYRRFGAGGVGLIWVEACAVDPRGRSNPGQLYLTRHNLSTFKHLVDEIRSASRATMGTQHNPVLILQLTHSGRYSKPEGTPAPIIAHHSKVLDAQYNLPPNYPLITDEALDQLQDDFVKSALLAKEVGFDGVDIKSCHRYLISELHASFTRQKSRYGGSFENRTRMLRETTERLREAVGDTLEVTCRLNVFDAMPYPYGFGVNQDDPTMPDLTEPLELIHDLEERGVRGINISIGNPYYNPHYGRPYDTPAQGGYLPNEHPLESMDRFIGIIRTIQKAHPQLTIIGGGYSWIRHHFPNIAAAVLAQGGARMIGVGRNGFAYPNFARDIIEKGAMDATQCCHACSLCTQIMRDGGKTGCVLKDKDVYGPLYREARERARNRV